MCNLCIIECVLYRNELEEGLEPVKIQSTIIFDLVVLSQLASTCKAVIEVYQSLFATSKNFTCICILYAMDNT